MKITDIKMHILSVPLTKPQNLSFAKMQSRNTLIIEVITNKNIIGIGESWINFPPWGGVERKATLEQGLFPLLVGENPLEINHIHQNLLNKLTGVGRQWGALGIIYQAISAIDIALWDILGKETNSPVYKILGGGSAKPVPIYASGIETSMGEEAILRWLKRGVKAFKVKVGIKDIVEEINYLQKIREIIPNDSKLMIDANQGWDFKKALDFLKKAKDLNLFWVEEPLPCHEYNEMHLIQKKTGIPVAAGENLYGHKEFRELLEKDAATVIQPDLTKAGGITSAKEIITLARAWNKSFAPHVYGSAIGLTAALHLTSAIPGGIILEVDSTENPLQKDLLEETFEIKDGCIIPSVNAGLGININYDFIEKYSV
ncbi:MAG: mandelate racemase/muconate lactonizing enzyme family protein [Atribacterota bacterium]|nr:mandelate racemase/muconate lactonizing enzyme family protein [Atribacterota bacterium]